MSTNFFVDTYGQRLHVGKRFGAGNGLLGFCFRAHHLPDGDLDSWFKWKNCLLAFRVPVHDEYGGLHDIDGFIAMVEKITPANRRRQFDMVTAEGHETSTYDDPSKGDREYLCPDGFSFTYARFS
jgi:hypothetical protein